MSEADLTQRITEQLKIESSDKVIVRSVVPEPKLTPVITVAVSLTLRCSLSESVLLIVSVIHVLGNLFV